MTLEYDQGVPAGGADSVESFFRKTAPIPVPKRTKSGMTELDIQPMILDLSCRQADTQTLELTCRVCAQNPSLNPMLLAEALRLHCPALAPDFSKARRLEVLDSSGVPFR